MSGSPQVKVCACGMGGTRATHRMHVEFLHAKRARIVGLVDVEQPCAMLQEAAEQVERCLLNDIAETKRERVAALLSTGRVNGVLK